MSLILLKLLLVVLIVFGFLIGCGGKYLNMMFFFVEISQLFFIKELVVYEGGKVIGVEFNCFLVVEGFLNSDVLLNDISYCKELLWQFVM